MRIWFIRCNGETAHNEPSTTRYVPGEPPTFPRREFNYRDECLCKGFARVGWPRAGDLREASWRANVSRVYGDLIKQHHVGFLEQFLDIEVGDLVLLPTYGNRYEVHIGEVIQRRGAKASAHNQEAYYYFFDIAAGDWFDNAHRVDVRWVRPEAGMFSKFMVPEIGGTWIRGFGQVKGGSERLVQLATGRSRHEQANMPLQPTSGA